jgi:manganese efflux pump family protein
VPALFLVAFSLGLSNFAASVGIGTAGVDAGTRLRLGAVFGLFETGMPILGLLLGHGLASDLGAAARWIGAGLLIITGGGTLIHGMRGRRAPRSSTRPGPGTQTTGRLLVTGLALSIDNLAAGFALGTYHVSLPSAVVVVGIVSVALSLLGLELGDRLGARAGERGEYLSGIILVGVGAAVAAGILT